MTDAQWVPGTPEWVARREAARLAMEAAKAAAAAETDPIASPLIAAHDVDDDAHAALFASVESSSGAILPWQALHAYAAGAPMTQGGVTYTRDTPGTSRATFDATEGATWTALPMKAEVVSYAATAIQEVDVQAAITSAGRRFGPLEGVRGDARDLVLGTDYAFAAGITVAGGDGFRATYDGHVVRFYGTLTGLATSDGRHLIEILASEWHNINSGPIGDYAGLGLITTSAPGPVLATLWQEAQWVNIYFDQGDAAPAADTAMQFIFFGHAYVPLQYGVLFADEFNGTAGRLPNARRWTYEIGRGDGGWGNGEGQYTTDSNAALDGAGNLEVVLRRETPPDGETGPLGFTGVRLTSRPLRFLPPCSIEARVLLPSGPGVYVALWLYGDVELNTHNWPKCGEIDIFESNYYEPDTDDRKERLMLGCFQAPIVPATEDPYETVASQTGHELGEPYYDDWHVIRLDWRVDSVRWYVDDVLGKEVTAAGFASSNRRWPYDGEFPHRLIVNVGTGGWGLVVPAEFDEAVAKFDYIRVTRLTP